MAFSPLQIPTESVAAGAVLTALDRILNSEPFRKTPSLRHLLQYLVTESIEGRSEQIKESIIAIDVFSRREGFDGRIDNIVRVQAHRLRKLLDAYYATEEGLKEPLRISVPKGSYVPQFGPRNEVSLSHAEPVTLAPEPPQPVLAEPTPASGHPHLGLWLPFAFVAGIAFTSLIFWFIVLPRAKNAVSAAPQLQQIWKPIFENGVRVIASYSNPSFLRVGRLPMLLIYNGPVSAPPGAVIELAPNDPYVDMQAIPKGQALHFSENWTGTGEVLAVNRLTMLSTQFQHALTVTPSRLLSLNEMRGANVIFVGRHR